MWDRQGGRCSSEDGSLRACLEHLGIDVAALCCKLRPLPAVDSLCRSDFEQKLHEAASEPLAAEGLAPLVPAMLSLGLARQ